MDLWGGSFTADVIFDVCWLLHPSMFHSACEFFVHQTLRFRVVAEEVQWLCPYSSCSLTWDRLIRSIIFIFPENLTVMIDDLERKRLASFLPTHENVVPVSTMNCSSCWLIVIGFFLWLCRNYWWRYLPLRLLYALLLLLVCCWICPRVESVAPNNYCRCWDNLYYVRFFFNPNTDCHQVVHLPVTGCSLVVGCLQTVAPITMLMTVWVELCIGLPCPNRGL